MAGTGKHYAVTHYLDLISEAEARVAKDNVVSGLISLPLFSTRGFVVGQTELPPSLASLLPPKLAVADYTEAAF
jgi:hypothetical protein